MRLFASLLLTFLCTGHGRAEELRPQNPDHWLTVVGDSYTTGVLTTPRFQLTPKGVAHSVADAFRIGPRQTSLHLVPDDLRPLPALFILLMKCR